ncbi:MAG TPA: hypothetical protein VNA88_02015 [Candidatus Kapabacteria bacterium]|nr:hypothetical protein [Candidatus Kapabacteria bacterium]
MKDSRNRPTHRRLIRDEELPPMAEDRSAEEWTDEDEELLRKHYRRQGAQYLARLLGRTPQAIRNQAYRRGLTRPPREEWTAFEDRYVIKNYPKRSVAAIARTLARSEQAVRARLRLHGLTRALPPKWMPIEDAFLRENYGRMTLREIAEELGRSEDSVSLKAARLGIREKSKHVEPKGKQLRYIVQNLGRIPFSTMATKIGTSVHVIRRIAAEHGYRARPLSRAWTDADEAMLRKLWGTMSPSEVAERLNRHETGVAARASALGLRRRRGRS